MPEKMTLHYVEGTTTEMDAVDARRALRDHPSEYSTAPFSKEEQEAARQKAKERRAEILKIKTSGKPAHEIEEHLQALDELQKLEKEEADKVARSGKPKAKAETAKS